MERSRAQVPAAVGRVLVVLSVGAIVTLPVDGASAAGSHGDQPPGLTHVGTFHGAAKVDRGLLYEIGERGDTTFIVLLRASAPVHGATGLRHPEQAQAVVSALKAMAHRAQMGARARVAEEETRGHVRKVRPLWVLNGLIVTGDAHALTTMAALPQTVAILRNWDTEVEPGAASDPVPDEGTGWNIAAVRADLAWPMATGARIRVGLIDTGADVTHPAIRATYGGDATDDALSWLDTIGGRPAPYDDNGHGTHTTGTLVGADGVGVAPGARWIMAKAFDASGRGKVANLLRAMEWMLAPADDPHNAPRVVSNSWGVPAMPMEDQALVFRPVIHAWVEAGIVPVFAAGNLGPRPQTITAPAFYEEAMAVGALDYAVYSGISVRALPYGPGPLVAVAGSGPPIPHLSAAFRFVGQACSPAGIADLAGTIALAEAGGCPFSQKDGIVQAAGAVAMVVHGEVEGRPPFIGGIPPTGIPAVAIRLSDGTALKATAGQLGIRLEIDPSTTLQSRPLATPVIAPFSSQGPSPLDSDLVKPDITAPGVGIRSAFPGGRFASRSGTSTAVPHVAGTIALLLEANPDLDVHDVRAVLQATSQPLGSGSPNTVFGYGSVDALAAVEAAVSQQERRAA